MSQNSEQRFDLFGDPVPSNWGERGRPEHVPSEQNRKKVSMLLALGWSNARIAAALFITIPTLRKHYFSELRYRATARDRLHAAMALKLWEEAQGGNIGAIREFNRFLDRNDLMLPGHSPAPKRSSKLKAPKVGKKEAERIAAREPDPGTTLGELMARRQGQRVQ